jgi:hypothetical protein
MIRTDDLVADLLFPLNAEAAVDLVWWTETELRAWLTEAAQELGRTGILTDRVEIAGVSGETAYLRPARTVEVIRAAWASRELRPATVDEMDALGDGWEEDETTGTPTRWVPAGEDTIRIHPRPAGAATLDLLRRIWTEGDFEAPAAVGAALRYRTLQRARSKDGEGQAADVAAVARMRADALMQACAALWGR